MFRTYYYADDFYISARQVSGMERSDGWVVTSAYVALPDGDDPRPLTERSRRIPGSFAVCSDGSVLRIRGSSEAAPGRCVSSDFAVDAALGWLEREADDGEVGWCLLESAAKWGGVCDSDGGSLMVVGEAGGSPAFVVTGGGFGFGAEFRPRRSRADGYATLGESLDLMEARLGGAMDVRAKRVAVVPRADSGEDGFDFLHLSWVGEVHADLRGDIEGRVQVWPMDWTGLLNRYCLAEAVEAAAGQRVEWMERWAAAHPGRAVPRTAARVFSVDEDPGGRTGLPVSCYDVDLGAGWQAISGGGFRRWKSPFGPVEEPLESAGLAAVR